jgi:hypothetical protein
MYWQVYLHKTVVSAEQLLIIILQRAKELGLEGDDLFATPPLKRFLNHQIKAKDFLTILICSMILPCSMILMFLLPLKPGPGILTGFFNALPKTGFQAII